LIPTLTDGLEGLQISVEEVTADAVETARELEVEVEPEDVTEFCNLMIKLQRMRGCFLRMGKERGFLRRYLLLRKML
jgi:hypothetical protein